MKITVVLVGICLLIGSCSPQNELLKKVDAALDIAEQQYYILGETGDLYPGKLPKTYQNDTVVMANSEWWTAGFVPGTMWYLYENSRSDKMKAFALEYSNRVEPQKNLLTNHDVGFMIYCPFGNALRIEPKEEYKDVIIQASKSLSTRYKENLKLIRSWDFNADIWQYPVIIDNMMNLEMLCAATSYSNDSSFYNIAINHADKTMKYHFRDNMSTYHVVSYDTITGLPHASQTFQGLRDDSEWSRGQAWALYGYTMMYRMTGLKRYLEHAKKIAAYLINHPQMPEDMIPYWDFSDPNIAVTPDAVYRDASAGAVICSALFDLTTLTSGEESNGYRTVAEKQLDALTGPKYLANVGELGGFILRHSVGSLPHNSEVDVPLTYADYYFVEAMMRYKALLKK